MKRWVLFFGMLGLGMASAEAVDSRYREFIIGERASGMGGAAVAIAQSVDAIYYNPAGLALTGRDSLSLSANLYGFEQYKISSGLFPGDDLRSDSFVTIPSAMGGVKMLSDEWAGGFGVFAPDTSKMSVITAKENGTHLYDYATDDQTMWIGPTIAWHPENGPWSLGLSVFGVYRSCQSSLNIFHEESGTFSEAYNFNDVGLAALFGVQRDLGEGWRAGATLRTPSLHLFGNGKNSLHSVVPDGSGGFYTDDVDTDNRQALQVSLGLGRCVPGKYAFAVDLLYHPATGYELLEWDFQGQTLGNSVHRDAVVDVSVGAEVYVAENYPFRFGFYTAFSSATVPDDPVSDEIATSEIDLYGFTISIGRETDMMAVNLGINYAFGSGDDISYSAKGDEIVQESGSARGDVILCSVSTSYFF